MVTSFLCVGAVPAPCLCCIGVCHTSPPIARGVVAPQKRVAVSLLVALQAAYVRSRFTVVCGGNSYAKIKYFF